MAEGVKRKPIGVLLKEKGFITEAHIQHALQEQKVTKEMLGELFERLGFVTEHDLVFRAGSEINRLADRISNIEQGTAECRSKVFCHLIL